MIRSVVLGLVIGVLFLALALWGVPLDQVGTALAHMDPAWLALSAVCWALQYLVRATRQLVMVRPLAPHTTFRTQLAIVMVGFFCINTFPARLGEVVRPFLLYERERVPLGAGLGLVFVERILDFVGLLVTVLVIVIWVHVPDNPIELFGREFSLVELGRRAALLSLPPIVAAVIVLTVLGGRAIALGERAVALLEAHVRAGWVKRTARALLNFAASFVEGVASLRDPRGLALVILLTGVLFLLMGAMTWAMACAFQFQEWIGFGQAFGVLCIIMLGIALPAPPGFAGVFEAAVRAALALFGMHGEELSARALAFALAFHWGPYLALTLWAGWHVWRDKIGLGRLFRFARGRSSPAPI